MKGKWPLQGTVIHHIPMWPGVRSGLDTDLMWESCLSPISLKLAMPVSESEGTGR